MDVVSLFSGCGGTDVGFQKAGHDLIWSNDINKWACASYASNLGFEPESGDISKIGKFPKAEIVVGCYPCQGFSIYGARKFNDPRNFLYMQFVRVLKQTKPKFFMAENVKGLLYGYGKIIFNDMLRNFKTNGYEVQWKLVNAKNYGVAQDRERVIMIGTRNDLIKKYEFPEETHGDGRKPYTTLKQVIWDMPKPNADEIYSGSFSSHYMSRNRKRAWDEVSFTIQASGRHAPLHPSGKAMIFVKKDKYKFDEVGPNRRMAYKECAVVQSLSKNFVLEGPLNEKYKQIGNAVPPLLAEAFAESFN